MRGALTAISRGIAEASGGPPHAGANSNLPEVRVLTRNEFADQVGWNGTADIIDVRTNITYQIRGVVDRSYHHSDFQPATENDCRAMRQAAGLAPDRVNSTNVADWTWNARPVLIRPEGATIWTAVSLHTFPHHIIVASGFYPVRIVDRNDPRIRNASGGWNIGSHFCLHYYDTITLRGAPPNDYVRSMHNAVVEAGQAGRSVDLTRLQMASPGLGDAIMVMSTAALNTLVDIVVPTDIRRPEPPQVIRQERFVLKFYTDPANELYSKFRLEAYADKVPFVLLPSGFRVGAKPARDFVGYCAVLVDNETDSAVSCIVGGVSRGNRAEYVSAKAGWEIGAEPENITQIYTPPMSGDFTIAVFTDFAPEWDVESDLTSQIESETAKRLAASVLHLNQNAMANHMSGGYMSPMNIDPSLIEKYVITIDRNTPNLNYSKLRDLGVIGVCIEAGCTQSMTHTPRSFRNPKLEEQVASAQAAGLEFSLFMYARARTTLEVERDVEELARVIRIITPKLGMWLKLQLSSGNNDEIVDEYYKRLVKLGFIGSLGFYCGRNQLEQINWERHKDNWLWWKVEGIDDITRLDDLLTPQFFMFTEEV